VREEGVKSIARKKKKKTEGRNRGSELHRKGVEQHQKVLDLGREGDRKIRTIGTDCRK